MTYKVLDGAYAKLAGTVAIGATSITLETGKGALFDVGTDHSYITFENDAKVTETVKLNGRSGDTLTISATTKEWNVNDIVECRPCAQAIADLATSVQISEAAAKATPADADKFGFIDSAASWVLKYLTWANIKSIILGLVQGQSGTAFTTTGTSTAYVLTPTPAIAANAANQRFRAKFHTAAGATPTMAISGQTALNLKYKDSTGAKQSITATQVPANWIADVENDGTDLVVLQTADVAHTGVAQSFGAVQTPSTGTAAISATGDFVYDPSTHGQVCTITLTNAITVTLKCSAGKISPRAHYKLIFVAGDTAARSFAKGTTVKAPGGALPITTASATSGAWDVFNLTGYDADNAVVDGACADAR